MSRNGRNLWFHMTSDFMIKPLNHWYQNLSDYIRTQEFLWSGFFVSDSIDPTGINYWCISEIIGKLCAWFSVMASVLLKKWYSIVGLRTHSATFYWAKSNRMNDMVISVSTILAIIKCKVLLLNYNIDYFYKVLQSAYQVPHTMTREEKS